ncbi:TetR/AcrR family transcriptional regulator [Sphaerisporangium sp. NBC_01403]|uniref:TetR/AcrR family transcriptional regulator n=1 Tax=Sphaerisporangium TaxID=321315 RepID=UPI003250FFFC
MATQEPVRRPGGRNARVRTAVCEAVLDLLHEADWDDLSIAQVAERSGVHQATIYRRWGTLGALVDDVVTEQLTRSSPVPDTGTLRGDLEAYAVQVAEDVAGPLGPVFLRAALVGARPEGEPSKHVYLLERGTQLQTMLDRARDRGENPPTLLELLEVILAPLYFHAMFFERPTNAHHARTLVDRLLALSGSRADTFTM